MNKSKCCKGLLIYFSETEQLCLYCGKKYNKEV